MSVTYSAGIVTAYGAAKEAGYTGTYTQFCQALADLAGIVASATTLPAGSQATATYNNGTLNLGIPKGDRGDRGEKGDRGETGATGQTGATGNGIASVTKTGTSGLVDTYTITFTDGTTTTFEITNGEDGEVTQAQLDAVIDDVTDLKTAIGLETHSITWIEGSYVNANTGSFDPYGGWHRSDYVEIGENNGTIHFNNTKNVGTSYNCFYNANHVKVGSNFNTNNTDITIPTDAVYFAVSIESAYDVTYVIPIAPLADRATKEEFNALSAEVDGLTKGSYKQDECLLLRNNLPSYYTDYPTTPASYNDGAYIDLKADEVSLENKNFIFITDVHWQSNAKNSNKLIGYLKKKLHIDTVIHGGDILDYDRDSPYLAAVHMRQWIDEARAAAGAGLLPVQGNHDVNTGSGRNDSASEADIMPYSVAESIQLDGCKPFIVQETDAEINARIASITFESDADRNEVIAYYKLHYYYDDAKNKIRYIVLNHGTQLNGVVYKYFGVRQFGEVFMQMDWLHETLMTTPNDYTVIVAMHAFMNWSNNKVESGPLQVCNMLSGFRTKNASCRVTNPYNTIPNYAYGYHYYDFTNAPTPKGVLCIGGDMHWDHAVVCRRKDGVYDSYEYSDSEAMHEDSIVVVHTQTDAYGRTYPSGTYVGDTWPMTQGTVTEQCFDVITMSEKDTYIDTTFVRVGAGENRHFKLSI